MEEIMVTSGMNNNQLIMFHAEMNKLRKDRTVGLLLTFFLGGIGGHCFYMGQTILGLGYLFFCWTFIPALIAFVELFLIMGRVDRYNEQKALEIAAKVRAAMPAQAEPVPVGIPVDS